MGRFLVRFTSAQQQYSESTGCPEVDAGSEVVHMLCVALSPFNFHFFRLTRVFSPPFPSVGLRRHHQPAKSRSTFVFIVVFVIIRFVPQAMRYTLLLGRILL